MTASDVANAIRNQNLDAPAGAIGQPPGRPRTQAFELPHRHPGPAHHPEQFGDIIVKVGLSSRPSPTSTYRRPSPRRAPA